MGYHDTVGHGRQETRQNQKMQTPPQANILAAASHVRRLFESKKFTYAVMGELAMLCLGHRCEMRDVLIAYDAKDYNRIKKKLEADRRIQLPTGMNPLFPSKILVSTGPKFLDTGCTTPVMIEVTLVPPGSYGTPPNGSLANNLVLLSLRTDGVLKTFHGLNTLYLVRTLLHFCQIGDLAWEPRWDILFLCQHYKGQLQSIRSHLDPKSVEQNFLRTAFLSQLPVQEQRRCYQVLSGQDSSSIKTPASLQAERSHIRSQSAFEVARSQGISRASLPEFLCPPRSQNLKSSYMRTAHSTSRLVEHTDIYQETASSSRDPPSRYRVVSAPNSRRTSPTDARLEFTPQVQPSYNQHLMSQVPVSFYHGRASSHSPKNIVPASMHQAGQQCMRIQPGFTGTHKTQIPAKDTSIATSPVIPDERTAHQGPQKNHSSSSGSSGKLGPEQSSSRLHLINPTDEATSLVGCDETWEKTHRLHLVGPEGVYRSPPTSRKPSPATNKTATALGNSLPVSELDETGPPNDILAELSANIDAALQVSNHPCASPPPTTTGPHPSNRPFIPRAHSAPLDMLPASLTIGNAPLQLPSTPPYQTLSAEPMTFTNLSRDAQQYTAPSLSPVLSSVPASPPLTPAPLSVYKAYQPFSIPTSPPDMDVSSPDSAGDGYRFRPTSFGRVKDIDGAGHYFATHARIGSQDAQAVSKSFDSRKLAMEYRAALPEFEEGYGGRDS